MMPVRKVSNRGGNIVGHFPSMKMKRMVAFESLIERDYLYLLDYEPEIEWFEEQPLTIEYGYDGKVLGYTPDFHIVEAGRDALVECKPLAFLDRDDNQRKFGVARTWCRNRGWAFRVVTDEDIRAGFRLENVKLLTRYARHVVEPGTKGRIYALLHHVQAAMSVDDLARKVASTGFSSAAAAILSMAFHHQLLIPLDDAPIRGETCVCLPPTQSKEASI